MRILFLSQWFPVPADNGSKLRIYHLLRGLSQRHDVALLSFANQPNRIFTGSEIRSICSDVHAVPWRDFNPHSRHARLGFLGLRPRSLADTYSAEMDTAIRNSLRKKKYHLVIASQVPMASYYASFQDLPALGPLAAVRILPDPIEVAPGHVRLARVDEA